MSTGDRHAPSHIAARPPLRAAGAIGLTGALLLHAGGSVAQAADTRATGVEAVAHPYVGMWVTADRAIRHKLLANGRYDEARGSRESAYRGRYVVHGASIDYVDDTGFTADGVFVSDDELHHGGMVLVRERP